MSFDIELKRTRVLSSSTMDFRFQRTDGLPVDFVPGQFFRFVFEDEKGEFERSYSLCNFESDVEAGTLDLMISTVEGGRASRLLFAASPGLTAKVTGPFGRLVLPEDQPERLFLVATSVGIAPYMSMLNGLGNFPEVHLLYGIRSQDEFIYGDWLTDFANNNPKFHLSVCVSRVDPVEPQFKGYVQDRLFQMNPDPATDHILLCGNPKMIDDIYPRLKALSFSVKQVVREKYVFAKDGVAAPQEMSDEKKRLLAEKMKKYQK